MKKVLIAVVLLAVIAAAAFFGFQYYVGMQVEKEVQNTLDRIPGVEKSSYGAVSYSVATKQLVVEKITLDFKPGGPTKAEIEKIEISNPDMKRIQNFLTNDLSASEKNVVDEMTVTGVTLSDDQASMTLGELQVEALKMGPTPIPADSPIEEVFSESNLPHLILALSAGRIEIDKYSFKDLAQKKDILALDRGLIEGLEGGRVANVEVRGFVVNVPDEDKQISVKTMNSSKLDYSALLKVLAEGKDPGEAGPGSLVVFERSAVGGVEVSSAETGKVSLAEAAISDYKWMGQLPISFKFMFKGLEVPVVEIQHEQAKQTLTQMGYEKMMVNFNLEYAWDAQAKTVSLTNITLGADEAAKLSVSLVVAGVDLSQIQTAEQAPALLSTATFQRAEIVLEDASLADRALKFFAAAQAMEPEQLRAMLIEQARMQGQMLGSTPAGAAIVDAVVAFIAKPGTLTLTAAPATPIPLMALAGPAMSDPGQVIDMLNLVATTKGGSAVAPVSVKTAPAPPQPAPEPAQPEPAQPEPAQPEPAQPEPAQPAEPGVMKAVPLEKLPFGNKAD
jgi:hypothetical protein